MMPSFHPMLVRQIHVVLISELRHAVTAKTYERLDNEESDAIMASEIPRSASFCGWMRNENESNEYLRGFEL